MSLSPKEKVVISFHRSMLVVGIAYLLLLVVAAVSAMTETATELPTCNESNTGE